ncbi:class I adenylate-forming enzyme family protein [Amycolatopsis sp. 195334CR]|uniref:class I adenylate-forming enzyme family protein n=1 Tax=Amycolatopsis sp. 195334CR TaxID=2814588 RepID=UPI001A8F3745|nr:AMP-binding protein [Amycolatopsis sp. 195334CR]MBN6040512.1 AMP-binding protein [Amycolatopsis sp. 195334CR]
MDEPGSGTPEFWARERPDAPAVVHGEEVLTYGEWNARADRVAEGLAALGLGAGDRLGMRFTLCPEWFVLQRAVQKLGVAQVAVSWKLTDGEVAHILRDSEAKGLAHNDNADVVVIVGSASSRYEDLLATPIRTPRFGRLRPELVLYTSGTTGAPRGVPPPGKPADELRARRYNASVRGIPPYPDHAITLLALPVHHGAGVAAATRTCAEGGTVVLLPSYDAERALALIERHRVQIWPTVPTMLLRVQKLPEPVFARYDLSSLTAVTVGAAPVPQSLKEWITDRLGGGLLWEGYGTSETGMISYTAPEFQLSKPGTSGIPHDGVEIAIVDEDWNRLPTGRTGEIAVSTPIVLRGYLGDEDLGRDAVRDGFFRTGDAGHLDEDGFLYLTDRVKDMIVAGGVNLYPAEIEKALLAHPAVLDAAVIGVPHDDFGEQPMAFLVADGLAEADLETFLDSRLAAHKHPRRYAFVGALPRNPMGKVLKHRLRAPYWKGRERRV